MKEGLYPVEDTGVVCYNKVLKDKNRMDLKLHRKGKTYTDAISILKPKQIPKNVMTVKGNNAAQC